MLICRYDSVVTNASMILDEFTFQTEMFSEALGQMGEAEVVLTWPAQGEGRESREEGWNRGTMWNDTKYNDGGYPTEFFQIVKEYNGGANVKPYMHWRKLKSLCRSTYEVRLFSFTVFLGYVDHSNSSITQESIVVVCLFLLDASDHLPLTTSFNRTKMGSGKRTL